MTPRPKHDLNALDPLADELAKQLGDLTPDMVEIDAMLGELAQRPGEPLGLSERVFLASVGSLPSESYRFADHAAKRSLFGRKLWFRSVSGQVAMAASVALAFGFALWFVLHPQRSAARSDAEAEFALAHALRPIQDGSTSALEGQIDYLLETNELTSPEDITSELAMLVRELEG